MPGWTLCFERPRAAGEQELRSWSVSQLSFHPDGSSFTQKELSTSKLFPKCGKQEQRSVADSPSRVLGQCALS